MKKILLVPACLFCMIVVIQAQSKNVAPPPPPPEPPSIEIPPPPPPPAISLESDDFFRKNPAIKGLSRQNDKVIVLLKDSSTEKYDFSIEKEKTAFQEKYGEFPTPPPPPAAPAKIKRVNVKAPASLRDPQ